MGSGLAIGYANFTTFLLLLSGVLLLTVDVRAYRQGGMDKERKVAKWLGWANLLLGLCVWAGNWLYQQWL
ncbi:CLC_0170 family protein [Paenibacillus sp. S-38]|uniref:CLC_0170 family protein n=1 Tax=Paenibacillus sp. S-38 TaxID=3416710 RepID=UPI003CEFA6FD